MLERRYDSVIDELNGCRSGENTIRPFRNRTGGIFCISTLSGFIVRLNEYIHRETPTEVTQDAVKAFTLLPSHQKYFERLEALGYDNMCNLQATVHVAGERRTLNQLQQFFWCEMRFRSFVDSFHIKKHICRLCSLSHDEKICCLNSKLEKFKKIFQHEKSRNYKKKEKYTKVNDEVK